MKKGEKKEKKVGKIKIEKKSTRERITIKSYSKGGWEDIFSPICTVPLCIYLGEEYNFGKVGGVGRI